MIAAEVSWWTDGRGGGEVRDGGPHFPRPPPPRPPPKLPILKPRGNGLPGPDPDPREPPLVKPRRLGSLLGPGDLKLDSAGIDWPYPELESLDEVDSALGLFWCCGGRGGTTGVASARLAEVAVDQGERHPRVWGSGAMHRAPWGEGGKHFLRTRRLLTDQQLAGRDNDDVGAGAESSLYEEVEAGEVLHHLQPGLRYE